MVAVDNNNVAVDNRNDGTRLVSLINEVIASNSKLEIEAGYQKIDALLEHKPIYAFCEEYPYSPSFWAKKNELTPGVLLSQEVEPNRKSYSVSKIVDVFTRHQSEVEGLVHTGLLSMETFDALKAQASVFSEEGANGPFMRHIGDLDLFFHGKDINTFSDNFKYHPDLGELGSECMDALADMGSKVEKSFVIFDAELDEKDTAELLAHRHFYEALDELKAPKRMEELEKFIQWRRQSKQLNFFELLQEDIIIHQWADCKLSIEKVDHSYPYIRKSIFKTFFGPSEYSGCIEMHYEISDDHITLNIPECFWSTPNLEFKIKGNDIEVRHRDLGSFELTFNSFCGFFMTPLSSDQKDGLPSKYYTDSMFCQLLYGQFKDQTQNNFRNFSRAVAENREKNKSYPMIARGTFTRGLLSFLNIDAAWDIFENQSMAYSNPESSFERFGEKLDDLLKFLPSLYPIFIFGLAHGSVNDMEYHCPNFLTKRFIRDNVLDDAFGAAGYLGLVSRIFKDLKYLKQDFLAEAILLSGSISLICLERMRSSSWPDIFRMYSESTTKKTREIFYSAVGNYSLIEEGENLYFFNNVFSMYDQEKQSRALATIKNGESQKCEFKQTFSLDIKTKAKNKIMENEVFEAIAGLLNSEGGQLFLGVSDSGEITGLDWEISKFHKSQDNFLLYFRDRVKNAIGPKFFTDMNYEILKIDDSPLLIIECHPSKSPVWLNESFFVRTNPATQKLEGQSLVQYCKNRFPD